MYEISFLWLWVAEYRGTNKTNNDTFWRICASQFEPFYFIHVTIYGAKQLEPAPDFMIQITCFKMVKIQNFYQYFMLMSQKLA